MRLVAFSDTHGHHRKIKLPEGDVLIFAGDMTMDGELATQEDFMDWWKSQPHEHKLLIAGNHDFNFNIYPNEDRDLDCINDRPWKIDGIKFWGHPWTPKFGEWAFMLDRGDLRMKTKVGRIPIDTNIIISHGPPKGACDRLESGERVGCATLASAILSIQPRLVICGHIHCGYGRDKLGQTEVINCSIVNEDYEVANEPVVVEL